MPAAFAAIADLPRAAIHGDLSHANMIRTGMGRVALIDWDEARLDACAFDLAGFAPVPDPFPRAHLAWEIASGWATEPGHARALAARM
ncbi:MAG: phosphotransferase [Rhodobacteraceae bacterium]|nr:phosphotransferase [Paracoccaceae bacterium]